MRKMLLWIIKLLPKFNTVWVYSTKEDRKEANKEFMHQFGQLPPHEQSSQVTLLLDGNHTLINTKQTNKDKDKANDQKKLPTLIMLN